MEINMKKQETQIQIEPKPVDDMSRKTYASPVFKEYGQVANLTKGGGPSARSDSGSNMMRPA